MQIKNRDMGFATGSGSATVVLAARNGQIVARSMWYTSPAAGTIGVYRAKQKTTANAAVSSSTTLVIDTDAAGKVGGAVLTTSDYVLVQNSATGTWYLEACSGGVAAVSSSTVSLTLANAISCAAGDVVYIVRAADIVTLTTAQETVRGAEYVFNGYPAFPVAAVLTASGTCLISVAFDEEG